MSAIAGAAGAGPESNRQSLVQLLLSEQRRYGSQHNAVVSINGATFGASPSSFGTTASTASNPYLILAADSRLDDREDLLNRVGGSSTLSDAELLLAAWVKAGEGSLSWISGDFALAVFDSRTRVLTLARDPSGQMPLHLAQVGSEFAFASMPAALRPFVGRLSVDRLAVAATLCDLRDDDPRSHFKGVSRVMPGEVVRLQAEGLRRRIYWNPPTAWEAPLRGVDLVAGYRHALDVAVCDRLKDSGRPIATHLSSGYDSSSVTATAARLISNPREIVAFTSAPATEAPIPKGMWRIADESEIAANTAATLGIRQVVVRESPPIRETIVHLSGLSQEPVIAVPNLAWLLQIRRAAAADGATCLLSGACGNISANAGGLYMLTEWIRRGRWLTWAQQARLAAARPDTHWRGVLYNSFKPWIPKLVSDALRRRYIGAGPIDGVTFLRPEWQAKALETAAPPPRHANIYEERIHIIRNDNVGLARKAGLAGEGVDERDPLSDRRLIEFSLRIPPEHFYWNGVSRPLAQKALADRVPKEVLELKRRGLQSADWATRFTAAQAHDMLDEIAVNTTAEQLFDFERIRRAIHKWPVTDWNQPQTHFTYRVALIGALSAGMFAVLHEKAARHST